MEIKLAVTDKEKQACYPVMHELRPQVESEQFLQRIKDQEHNGYQLVYGYTIDGIVAVAGFRLGENLAFGRYIYVDDLVTNAIFRSKRYGSKLLAWIKKYGAKEGCSQIHLDSGIQKVDAHRFYEREGLLKGGFHFIENI